jgi:hypothetical protein
VIFSTKASVSSFEAAPAIIPLHQAAEVKPPASSSPERLAASLPSWGFGTDGGINTGSVQVSFLLFGFWLNASATTSTEDFLLVFPTYKALLMESSLSPKQL